MLNKALVEKFHEIHNSWKFAHQTAMYTMKAPYGIKDEALFRLTFGINREEEVLYCRDLSNGRRVHGLVISDIGIRKLENGEIVFLPWSKIVDIKLDSSSEGFLFILKDTQIPLDKNLFFYKNDISKDVLNDTLLVFKRLLDLSEKTNTEDALTIQTILSQQLSATEIFDCYNRTYWTAGLNKEDSMIRPYIKDPYLFRLYFGVESNEELLYCRDKSYLNSRNQGTVITDRGIRVILDNDNPSDMIEIWWEDICDVTYKDEVFYFWYSETKEEGTASCIHESFFFKDNINKYNSSQLVELFKKIANAVMPQTPPGLLIIQEMDKYQESDPEKAWKIGLEALGKYSDWERDIQWKMGWIAHWYIKDNDRAWKMFMESLKGDDLNDICRSHAYYCCSNILYEEDNSSPEVRKLLFNTASGNKEVKFNDDILLWEQAKNEIRSLEEEYFGEKLADRPYAERKLIFPVNNLFNLSTISQDHVMPVELDSLLANPNLKFPLSHPQANQLYVAHPYNPNVYLLYDNYEIEILQDKLRELSEIAQVLGATEIDVKVISSYGHHSENKGSLSRSGRVEHWTQTNIGASQDKKFTRDEEMNLEHMFNRHQTFAPKSSISEPTNTIWLQGEPSWQRLIKQRLEGGLTSHKEVIETRSSRVISGTASNQLKGEIESIFADLNLNWNKSEESRYSEHNNLVVSVDIKFSNVQSDPKSGMSSNSAPTFNDAELEYKEEYEACLTDGVISTSERRLLDRIAGKLGLSQEQVRRIEEGSGNPLTDEEKEYLDEYHACIADDPALSASTRRLLAKMAKSLGLSEEQVNKLENLK